MTLTDQQGKPIDRNDAYEKVCEAVDAVLEIKSIAAQIGKDGTFREIMGRLNSIKIALPD